METNFKPQEDLIAIRNMMERSSKFLSLSGLSGIFAGCCAIVGVIVAYFIVFRTGSIQYNESICNYGNELTLSHNFSFIFIGLIVLLVALSGAIFFSIRKSRKKQLQFWSNTTKQLLIHLFIPLIAGGFFSLILIEQNNIQLVASTTLIFYGLALVNAGKFTFGEIHYLGLCEIALGLLAGVIICYGMLFWILGFGLLHIVYGFYMYWKYER